MRQVSGGLSLRAVVFDLDDTLLDRRGSFRDFVRDQWSRFPPIARVVAQEQYVDGVIDLDRDGYAPRREVFGGLTPRFGLSADLTVDLLADYRARFPSACRLFPDVLSTLALMRAAGLKLGLITNGSARMQTSKLQCLALASVFDTVLISETEGLHKPDVRIFHRALERLEVTPRSAAFVGDHPDVDIAGARAAGMVAIWRRDAEGRHDVEADAAIKHLSDLPALLQLGQ